MRALFLAAAMVVASVPAGAFAQAAPKFSTASSTIGQLMADPQAKAVLEKHLPQISQAGDQVAGQTLKQLQGMAPDRLPDAKLAEIDADLAKIK
jgi:para-nitrobenzyl esterase